MLIDRQLVPQHRLLRAIAQPVGLLHGPAVATQKPDDDLQQRALAGTVLTDQPHKLTTPHLERRAAENLDRAAHRPDPTVKGLTHATDPQNCPDLGGGFRVGRAPYARPGPTSHHSPSAVRSRCSSSSLSEVWMT